jgi:alpha-1,2-mannosyltransferase
VAGESRRGPLWLPFLQVAAVFVTICTIGAVLLTAGPTLGYDFRAYLDASRRILDGLPLYDSSVDVAGGFAVYLYPPPFAIALIPLALLPGTVAPIVVWMGICIAALVAAIAILPVRPWIKWTLLLLCGLTWQTFMAVKLGQVGPLLLLCFAVAWRSLDRPVPLAASIAAGTLLKLQPALMVPWAVVTGRWRAAAIAVILIGAVCLASVAVVGVSAWADYIALLRRVSDPIPTPRSVSPGAVAYQLGLGPEAASLVQWTYVAGAVAITLHAWFRRDEVASLVVTAVASQVISPIVWDHYAIVLLLPVALVLDRLGRRGWPIVLLPLAGWLPLPWYPVLFAIGLLAAWAVGRERSSAPRGELTRDAPLVMEPPAT